MSRKAVKVVAKRIESDEHYVLDLCDEVLGNIGVRQFLFPWLLGDLSARVGHPRRLPVDGYWPRESLVVEFQEK